MKSFLTEDDWKYVMSRTGEIRAPGGGGGR